MRARIGLAIVLLLGCRSSEPTVTPASTPATPAASPKAPAEEEPAVQAEIAEPVDPALLARQDYDQALQTAARARSTCARDPSRIEFEALLDAYEILAPYERSTERDRAIKALERCRQLAAAYIDQNLSDLSADPAADYTGQVQGAVDEANERTTKRLSITVRGSQVTVDDEGGRTREQKRALEGYCAKANTPDVTRVGHTTDDRGDLSCSTQFSFSKQSGYVDRRMRIATPFELETTEGKKIPPAPTGE